MTVQIGEVLVHPHHGVVTVKGFETRDLRGEPARYLVLAASQNSLTIKIPASSFEDLGMRRLMDPAMLERLSETLSGVADEGPANWSRRFKSYEHKMASGNLFQVAEVVRDLLRGRHERGISPGERRMLDRARSLIAGEMAAMPQFSSEEAAVDYIDARVLG
ncbi:CarD family transcriptional regulator [Myceligenerans indicum]|uniref:CarD family transcriptional regulator n=1 Tax=Myceligenerans indicum TaxID=2593663 RepID=A0ABS1LH00_9MICO|nr:CarD family transcriptional regulator [Myceligenerans indicum]MBL0885491.1 CarD family transcriptional regulator [Myceligenerans indicum]